MIFSPDREITVIGTLLNTETADVSEFAYEYPLIQVGNHDAWPVKDDGVGFAYPPCWRYDLWNWHLPTNYAYRPLIAITTIDLVM
ncbi:MAG: Slp family lipoprotein [Gammaproteobacteria bacterium]|nr:Slp family lipoprotein [Gammaproteobacteria bacterium]